MWALKSRLVSMKTLRSFSRSVSSSVIFSLSLPIVEEGATRPQILTTLMFSYPCSYTRAGEFDWHRGRSWRRTLAFANTYVLIPLSYTGTWVPQWHRGQYMRGTLLKNVRMGDFVWGHQGYSWARRRRFQFQVLMWGRTELSSVRNLANISTSYFPFLSTEFQLVINLFHRF